MNSMTELKKLYRKSLSLLAILGLLLFSAMFAWAQTAGPPLQSSAPVAKGTQEQDQKPASANPATQEQKISPKEAEELFHDVDQILQFAGKDSGLPIKKEVKRRLTSRDEVVAYLEKNMAEDKDAQRLRRSELVLKKFGLLPRNFDLQTFLVERHDHSAVPARPAEAVVEAPGNQSALPTQRQAQVGIVVSGPVVP